MLSLRGGFLAVSQNDPGLVQGFAALSEVEEGKGEGRRKNGRDELRALAEGVIGDK